jgi:hypothetical protein
MMSFIYEGFLCRHDYNIDLIVTDDYQGINKKKYQTLDFMKT